jgi:hypothetical protein
MFVYKYNEYTKKYYKYDSDLVDLFDPMFDDDLHDNNLTPMTLLTKKCMYCNTEFSSRNQLFHHLGFMNIDIRNANFLLNYEDHHNSEMGEFGFEPKKKNHCRYRITKRRKNKRVIKPVLIEELLTELKL